MEEYDLIVIGSGSGLEVASAYANRGNKVAVVEPGRLGGTCLNRGCIPSKMLIHHADIIEEIQGSESFHIDSEINDIDFQSIVEEVNNDVHGDAEAIEQSLKESDNHTLYQSEASFVDRKTLNVDGKEITSDLIVIAAGSRPITPPINGLDSTNYWTSKEALNPDYQPSKLVIVGGGYISTELAYFYDSMGTEITIIEMEDCLLNREDRQISEKLTEIAEQRYNVELGAEVTEISETDNGKVVKTADKGEFIGDEVLIAAGRTPNSDKLGLDKVGIETNENGFVNTDEHLETNVEGVYALGDIADNWMFKHSANHEAEIVYKNIVSDNQYELESEEMPHAVFTQPQVAGIGKTEQKLEEELEYGVDYISSTYEYRDTGMGSALKEEDGFVKVLADAENGDILGCHILGPDASQLIHEVLVAMTAGTGTVQDIKDTIHIHPALNEVVDRAFNQIR